MEKFQNKLNLIIAGYSINLISELEFELEEGYLPFTVQHIDNKPDIEIQCFKDIRQDLLQNCNLVFEAKNDEQRFYSIYRNEENLIFVIYNQQNRDEIQQMAVLDKSFTRWEVYSNIYDGKLLPLKYPMGPIIMHYMTLKSDAVMMHASCAFDGQNARIFTGFSGNGKSTISKLWSDAGNLIINDDRIIIRKNETGYAVYNTPMYYQDRSKKAPLSAIYLISHSPENKIKKLCGALAISKVMAFSIQNNFDKQFIQSRLDFFSNLCQNIPVYELGFVPDKSVINFILANEKTETK